eukprot:15805-Heterococcus_DN1.PRE.1
MLDRSTLRPSALLLYGVGPAPCAAPVSAQRITSHHQHQQHYVSYTCSASCEVPTHRSNQSLCTTLLCTTWHRCLEAADAI